MTRMLKALGLGLLAVFAFSALVAQAASAHEFKAAEAPATITGEDDPVSGGLQKFTAGPADTQCTELHATGIQTEVEEDELTVVPQYSDCEALGFPATVNNVGSLGDDETGACAYNFDSDTVGEHAPVDVECEAGGSITIEAFFDEAHTEELCTIHVGAQNDLNGVHYNNVKTTKEEVTLEATVSGIHYTYDGPWCFLVFGDNEGEGSDATYEGNATVKAFKGGSQIDGTITS